MNNKEFFCHKNQRNSERFILNKTDSKSTWIRWINLSLVVNQADHGQKMHPPHWLNHLWCNCTETKWNKLEQYSWVNLRNIVQVKIRVFTTIKHPEQFISLCQSIPFGIAGIPLLWTEILSFWPFSQVDSIYSWIVFPYCGWWSEGEKGIEVTNVSK